MAGAPFARTVAAHLSIFPVGGDLLSVVVGAPLSLALGPAADRLAGLEEVAVQEDGARPTGARREEGGADAVVEVTLLLLQAEANPVAKTVVRRVVRKLLGQARKLGAVPLPMLLQMGKPGRSFHAGGSFPMRTNPSVLETDTIGRPAGWRRVHAVDATVLPSIPATTITLTVMANAHRIGWDSATTSD